MKFIHRNDILDPGLLGLLAFVLGLALSIFLVALAGMLTSNSVDILDTSAILSGLTLLVAPCANLWMWHDRIITRRRLMGACICASTGVALPFFILAFLTSRSIILSALFTVATGYGLLTAAWCGIATLLWPVVCRLAPIRVQDGETCPQCGYCVRGVASRICPECGRAFNRDDLGLPEVVFDELVSDAQADTRTAEST